MVLLVAFLSVPQWEASADLDVVEMFAGVARIAKLAAWMGLKSRAYDIRFHKPENPTKPKRGKFPRSSMDLNGSAGFVFLS